MHYLHALHHMYGSVSCSRTETPVPRRCGGSTFLIRIALPNCFRSVGAQDICVSQRDSRRWTWFISISDAGSDLGADQRCRSVGNVCRLCNYGWVVEKMDLRLRRRRQTTSEVRDVAVRLMGERGFDKVTIEEICAEAGISQRTFFNYFPTKESAIAYNPFGDLPAESIDEFIAAGTAPAATLLAELIALLSNELESAPGRGQAAAMLHIAATTPAVHAALFAEMESFESELVQLVAQRLDSAPGDDTASLIAALATATVRCGLQRWMSSDAAGPNDTPVPHVRRTAELLREIFTTT